MGHYQNPENLRFFQTISDDFPFWIGNDTQGNYFTRSGGSYDLNPSEYLSMESVTTKNRFHLWKEVDLNYVLEKIRDFVGNQKEYRQAFLSYLGLPDPNIQVSDKQRDEIVSHLWKSRAFNEDSALKISKDDLDTYQYLVIKGFIGCYDGRYFVKNVLTKQN